MALSAGEKIRIIFARILLIILAPLHSFFKSREEKSSFVKSNVDTGVKQKQMIAALLVVVAIAGVSWAGVSITGNIVANKNQIANLTGELQQSQERASQILSEKNQIQTQVTECNAQYLSCTNDLTTTTSDLNSCKTDLNHKNLELDSCSSEKDTLQTNLNSVTADRDSWKSGYSSLEVDSAKKICGCPSSPAGEVKNYDVTNNAIVCTANGTRSVTC